MKPRTIRLVDLGLHDDFSTYVEYVARLLDSRERGSGREPDVIVEQISSSSIEIVDAALFSPAHVLHLTAHSFSSFDDVMLASDHDGGLDYSLVDLGEAFRENGHPIGAPVLLLDACGAVSQRFQQAVRGLVAERTLLIGSSRALGWLESTAWSACFYTALLRAKGKGWDPVDWAADAVQRSNNAYLELTGGSSPYKAVVLEPNRAARRAFARA